MITKQTKDNGSGVYEIWLEPRNPKRNKANEFYKATNGDIKLKDIASI